MKQLRFSAVLFFVALALTSVSAATTTASSVLAALRSSIVSAPAVDATFTINGEGGKIEGSAILSGAAFTFSTPQIEVWYDGATQWAYLASTGEVSITEPDAEELAASNPFAILSTYEQYYTARRLPDSNGRKRVELQPKDKSSGISSVVVIADNACKWPQTIVVTFSDGRKIDLFIDHIARRNKPAQSVFRYDAKKHPASEIIDLR